MARQDRYMSTVKVGPKGQIVIPKEVREMFGIEPGDLLMLLADSERGIAIQRGGCVEQVRRCGFRGEGGGSWTRMSRSRIWRILRRRLRRGSTGVMKNSPGTGKYPC